MTYDKPVPNTDDPVQARFWAAAKEHRFELQECGDCGARRWIPSPVCPECLTRGGEWVEVEPGGSIWSYAIYDRPYRKEFAGDVPYAVAMIKLDAGPKMISNVMADIDDLRVDARVLVTFDDVDDDLTLVKFALDA